MSTTTTSGQPIAHSSVRFLAAKDNPLAIEQVTRLQYRDSEQTWESRISSLVQLNFRAAIVGHKGSGKTTLLYELQRQLDRLQIASHLVFLPHEKTAHEQLICAAINHSIDKSHRVILVDGIERISFFQRRRLLNKTKRARGLVITVHQPWLLPTWIHCQTSCALMRELLCELNLDFPEIQSAGEAAFDLHRGNIRLAMRDLYDQFSSGKFNEILSR